MIRDLERKNTYLRLLLPFLLKVDSFAALVVWIEPCSVSKDQWLSVTSGLNVTTMDTISAADQPVLLWPCSSVHSSIRFKAVGLEREDTRWLNQYRGIPQLPPYNGGGIGSVAFECPISTSSVCSRVETYISLPVPSFSKYGRAMSTFSCPSFK